MEYCICEKLIYFDYVSWFLYANFTARDYSKTISQKSTVSRKLFHVSKNKYFMKITRRRTETNTKRSTEQKNA